MGKVKEHSFEMKGKGLEISRWLEVYGKSETEQDIMLPALPNNDEIPSQAKVIETKNSEDVIGPLAPDNEATLLSPMKSARKFMEKNLPI
jgi:DNA topoisomerase IA